MSDRLLDAGDGRPVHFVGIAGAGMSALAELFVRRGLAVTGCDSDPSRADDLRALGVPLVHGHSAEHVVGARALVHTSAVPASHPELVAARTAGIPVIRRAEALAMAVSDGRLVGVAGTHGKSTTTVMTAAALVAAGYAPTALVGARVADWGGNLLRGGREVYVVEADEYDRSFLALDPDVAVVTNLEADHLDIYSGLDDLRAAFAQYIARARYTVLCADDPGANALPSHPTAEVVRYGIESADARLVARAIRAEPGGSAFEAWFDSKHVCDVALRVPGEHNARNALAALAVGLLLGGPARAHQLASGLARFSGVERRFQRLGDVAGVTVVDDYAHHPTELRATIAAARAAYPGRRLVLAFQPHLFSRTRDFAQEFAAALAAADVVLVADIYPAREAPIPGVTSDLIVAGLTGVAWQGPTAGGKLARALAGVVRPGDVVLTVGAGDVTNSGPQLIALLGGREVWAEPSGSVGDAKEPGCT